MNILKRSQYFKNMINVLLRMMFFKNNDIFFSIFLWLVLPVIPVIVLGWIVGDMLPD